MFNTNPKKNKAARRERRAKQAQNELKMIQEAKKRFIPCRKCTIELQKEFNEKIVALDKEYYDKQRNLIIERNNKADEIRTSMKVQLTSEQECSKHKKNDKSS